MSNRLRLVLCLFGILGFASVGLADIYVANQFPAASASVTAYAPTAIGNAAPVRTIAGALTGFNSPETVTADTVNSELYVADFGGKAVRVFPLNANGNVAPTRTLIDGPNSQISQVRMVAVDTVNNELIVVSINNAIRVFARTASGDAVPLRTISGANTKLNNPVSLALDSTNNEIFTDSYDVGGPQVPGILVFSRTASGNVAPLRFISGSNTQMGNYTNYVTLDLANNEVYAQGDTGSGVVVFPRTASGNVAPTRNITGPSTGLNGIGGILVDNANNRLDVVVTNQNEVRVFPRTASGDTVPLMLLAGNLTGLSSPFGIAVAGAALVSVPPPVVVAPAPILSIWLLCVLGLALAWIARSRARRA